MMSVGEKPTVIPFTINRNARIPKQRQKYTTKNLSGIQLSFVTLGLGSDGYQHFCITILLLAIKRITD